MSVVLVTGGSGTLGPSWCRSCASAITTCVSSLDARGAGTHLGNLRTRRGRCRRRRRRPSSSSTPPQTRHRGSSGLSHTRHLLAAARDAQHLLYASLVASTRFAFGYTRRRWRAQARSPRAPPHTWSSAPRSSTGCSRSCWRESNGSPGTAAARLALPESGGLRRRGAGRGAPRGRTARARTRYRPAPEVLSGHEIVAGWREARARPRRVVNLCRAGSPAPRAEG